MYNRFHRSRPQNMTYLRVYNFLPLKLFWTSDLASKNHAYCWHSQNCIKNWFSNINSIPNFSVQQKCKILTTSSLNPSQFDVWECPLGLEGGSWSPPPIYLGSGTKFSPKIIFPWKVVSLPILLTLVQNIFLITPQKISKN